MVQFKNHAEKDFWQEVYLKSMPTLYTPTAAADEAVEDRRVRMLELNLGQKPPEALQLPAE